MRIVCAGTGIIGIETARLLRKQLPLAIITVISKDAYHPLAGHIPELLSGHVRLEELHTNIEHKLRKLGVECIRGAITSIERDKKLVHIGDISVQYDLLLLDVPSEPDRNALPGLDIAYCPTTTRDMLELRQHIVTQLIKARNTNKPEYRTFVVAGAGVAGIELITELTNLIDSLCDRHFLFPQEITLVLIEQKGSSPLPAGASKKVQKLLEKKNIEYYNDDIKSYSLDGVQLTDRTIETQTLIWTAKLRGNALLQTLNVPLDSEGRATLNAYGQTSDPNIFVATDTIRRVPHDAHLSGAQQLQLAQNISAAAHHKPLRTITHPKRPFIITTGDQKALLVWGSMSWHGRTPYKLKRWFAQRIAQRLES